MFAAFRRRYWLLLVPFAAISALTALAARALPDWYRSETLILVVPQRVPEDYVKPTVTTRIEDRLNSISQQILSRTRLERVIHDFNLYADERSKGIMEDIVERMRSDIKVNVVKGDAFRVSYVGRDPRTVMKVTDRLASLFIEENLRDREILAEGTNQFLEAQLDDARRRLIEQEKKLEVYRRQHSGQLPSQLPSNLQAVQSTQLQIQSLVESLNRDRDRRLVLERLQADAESDQPATTPAATSTDEGSGQTSAGSTAVVQLEAARAQLKMLELRFKPGHPDIGLLKRRIKDLEQKADAEAGAVPLAPPRDDPRARKAAILATEIQLLDGQIAQKVEEEKRLRQLAATYQSRAEAAPSRETELVELTRDYTTIQAMYTSLLGKKEESKIAANLERRQIGEQFKLLDPARMPERAFSPNRLLINGGGILGGLVVGLLLLGLFEYRDTTFGTDEDVVSVLSLPVLAVIPSVQSKAERRAALRWQLLTWVGLGGTVLGCLAVTVWTLVH